jgi:Sulfotransferase family
MTMPLLDAVYAGALAPCAAPFAVAEVLARAERATGLAEWGGALWAEGRFRARLDALCQGLENEAQLHDLGRSRAHSRLHVLLCTRLRQVDHYGRMVQHPPIVAPLVGTGLPRAGTTFLHGLLAADPGNRVANAAQAAIPIPPPGAGNVSEAARIALYQSILDFQGFTASEVTAIHPYAAAAPEECVFMQESACAMPLGAFYNAPGFSAVVAKVETGADAYAWQKGMMQSLQGDKPIGRWLLKAPAHVMNMDGLITAFPDARIFLNHRDPGKVIPSMASLYMKLYSLASDSSVDPLALGPRLVANWAGILDRLDAWREANPHVPVVDVHYSTLIAEPLETAERLYAGFGIDLSGEVRDAMAAHLKVDHHGKGPARAYGLADFGLCEADIESAFGAYIDRHGIAREKRQ